MQEPAHCGFESAPVRAHRCAGAMRPSTSKALLLTRCGRAKHKQAEPASRHPRPRSLRSCRPGDEEECPCAKSGKTRTGLSRSRRDPRPRDDSIGASSGCELHPPVDVSPCTMGSHRAVAVGLKGGPQAAPRETPVKEAVTAGASDGPPRGEDLKENRCSVAATRASSVAVAA